MELRWLSLCVGVAYIFSFRRGRRKRHLAAVPLCGGAGGRCDGEFVGRSRLARFALARLGPTRGALHLPLARLSRLSHSVATWPLWLSLPSFN